MRLFSGSQSHLRRSRTCSPLSFEVRLQETSRFFCRATEISHGEIRKYRDAGRPEASERSCRDVSA